MPITVDVDRDLQVATYVFSGPVTGSEYVNFIAAALSDQPMLADCDAVCDVTAYTGDVGHEDMARVAAMMNEARLTDRSVCTALVSHDSGFANWAAVMNFQFVGRRFRVFTSTFAAKAWLDGVQQGRAARAA